jgi:subtilase family protein
VWSAVRVASFPRDLVEAVNATGDGAVACPRFGFVILPDDAAVSQVIQARALDRPRSITPEQRSVIAGLHLLVDQAARHEQILAPNGNPRLAQAGSEVPLTDFGYPVLEEGGIARSTTPVPTRLGWIAAVNLSIGSGAGRPHDPTHPVSVALTNTAKRILPVVAAGNSYGTRRGAAAMTAWARHPAVISVSALRDWAIAPDSAIGWPNDRNSWPDVASPDDLYTEYDAVTGKVDAFRGTSSAAPVVTRQLVKLAAFLLTARSVQLGLTPGAAAEGVPRVGAGIVDTPIIPTELPVPPFPFGALPIVGVSQAGMDATLRACRRIGLAFDPTPRPPLLRRVLRRSATAVAGHAPFQVGSGSISDGSTATYLAQMTGLELVTSCVPRAVLTPALARQLKGISLVDSIGTALQIWERSSVLWAWDYRAADMLWHLSFIREGSNEPQ